MADSTDSSPATFYTTKEGSDDDANESTTASTPAHAQPCPYRQAGELSRDLQAHCHILFEEHLYLGAIHLLNSMLGAGTSRRRASGKPAPVPPASHLALLNTIAIHPLFTTRAEEPENLQVSSLALGYLRSVLESVGPVNAGFRTAFRFHHAPRGGRRAGRAGYESDSDATEGGDEGESPLKGRLAGRGSVWARAQDFWSAVGWAFNCCTTMPHRWRYWRAWMELMLDVLDADWEERRRLDEEGQREGGTKWRSESMIAMYMDQQPQGILKALLAYGGSVSSGSFPEVFEKEHRGPKKQRSGGKRKREQLDLANDKFGDYLDDECFSSGVSEPPTPRKRGRREDAEPFSAGMVESIGLRLRLFGLVSAATFALRKRAELQKLYEDFAAGVKVLPLEVFALVATQRPNPLLLEAHVTLTKELFHLLLPASYKDPEEVDAAGSATGSLTMPMLEQCYACHAANTVGAEDNAKLSLVVEAAVQLLWHCDMMEFTEAFAAQVDKGVRAREKKAQKRRGRGRTDAGDVHALAVLSASGERIRVLLDVLRAL